MTESPPSFFARLSLALGTFLRLLSDGAYAARLRQLPEASASSTLRHDARDERIERIEREAAAAVATPRPERDLGPALQLLSVLQREGRLVDFLQQDILSFSDADIGAAARVVHQGCQRALKQTLTVEPIHTEAEGSVVELRSGFDAKRYRLLGNVQGQAPYSGILRHRGWRVTELRLADPLETADLTIVAPAEVEL